MDSHQGRPEQGRARAKSSAFSFRSQGSEDNNHPASKSPKSKHSRKESDSERRKTHYDPTTKANPNAAMNEAQPIAAALEKPTLQSLRSFQHSDVNGNLIAEPDLSNPTRSRWERPLDTIRSFEAAIDGEYRRRASQMRSDQTDVVSNYGGASRRSSYYGGGGPDAQRYSSHSYYGSQNYGGRAPRDSYDNGYGQGGPVGGPPRVRYGNRMQSDPGWGSQGGSRMSQGQNVYGQPPPNGHQQSRDTVHTNGSNGSNSDGAYGTDPSDNSSFERSMPVRPPHADMGEQYGANGYGGPIREEQQQQHGGYFPGQQHQYGAPPPPPHAAKPVQPKAAPIPLGAGEAGAAPAGRPGVLRKESSGGEDKRRSWFKRRFSKD
ncbi:hypothetical protein E8E12_009057 [Didymella heteroderae]|uniref:Uncharacterized protein n=1 Tax=Didymella heteroderae TaxID=1769908 RepID=A0A9P4WRV2_9PLEO|nr:hypothetical protein E8E12_009057 [Didymella heteroderae]